MLPPRPSPPPTVSRHQIPEIDGLRALAIIGVVFVHCTWPTLAPFTLDSPIADWWLPLRLVLESGWLGVNLLFFLSGLVLYLPYARGERRMAGWTDAWAFLRRRARRLMPLYYLSGAITLAFGLSIPFDPTLWRSWLNVAAFLTASFTLTPFTFVPRHNYVLWSLGVEFAFSLLFPLLLWLYARHRTPLLLAAVAIAVGVRLWVATPPAYSVLHWAGDGLLGRLPDFLFGMLAVDLALARSRLFNPVSFLVLGVGGAFAGMAVWHFYFIKALPISAGAFPPLLLDVGFLFGVGFLLTHPNPLNALLRLWPVRIIGAMSYSIYIWHIVLLKRLVLFRPSAPFREPTLEHMPYILSMMPVYLGFLLFLSALSYRYIEFGHRPARDVFLLNRRAARNLTDDADRADQPPPPPPPPR